MILTRTLYFVTLISNTVYSFPVSFDACETRKPCKEVTSEQVNYTCYKMLNANSHEKHILWSSLLKLWIKFIVS